MENEGASLASPEVLCVMSREHWAQRTIGGLQTSIALAKAALRRHPQFATAHGLLAKAHVTQASYGHTVPTADLCFGEEAALRALAIDGDCVEAHQALAFVNVFRNQWKQARCHFDEALRLNPHEPTTYQWFSIWQLAQDRDAEALEMAARAEELDPTSLIIAAHRAWMLHLTGRYEAAVRQAAAVIRRNRHFWRGYFNLALALAADGRAAEASDAIDVAISLNDQTNIRAVQAHTTALAGNKGAARKLLTELMQSPGYRSAYWMAFAAAALGDEAMVFEQLNAALEHREWFLVLLKHDSGFVEFRSSAHFDAIRRQVGLP